MCVWGGDWAQVAAEEGCRGLWAHLSLIGNGPASGYGDLCFIWQLRMGAGEGCLSTVKRSVGRGSAPRPPKDQKSAHPAKWQQALLSAAPPPPPPPPPSLRAEVSRGSRSSPSPHTSVRRTESQREPRLSPGSLSPRALTQPVSNRRLRLLSFFFFSPLLFFSSPVLPLSGLVTELWPIAALPAGAGCLLIGPLGARSRLPLLFPSKADKRRRLRARATGISQSLPSLSSLPPRSSPSLPPVPARVLWASTLGWRPAPGPYHSDRG